MMNLNLSRLWKCPSVVTLATLVAVVSVFALQQYAYSQGLVGAPVDPRFATGNEVGTLADYGYDTARDIGRVSTAFSFVFMIMLSVWRICVVNSRLKKIVANTPTFDADKRMGATCLRWIGATLMVPTALHLICTLAINNFTGCGGL